MQPCRQGFPTAPKRPHVRGVSTCGRTFIRQCSPVAHPIAQCPFPSVDTWSNSASVPFIVVYSVPTGSGDAGAWYHSKRTYSINTSNHKILCGEHINLYCMSKPELKNDNRYIELETYSSEGDNLDTEAILAVSLHSDSGSAINTKILVSHAGYNLGNEIHRHIKLVT